VVTQETTRQCDVMPSGQHRRLWFNKLSSGDEFASHFIEMCACGATRRIEHKFATKDVGVPNRKVGIWR